MVGDKNPWLNHARSTVWSRDGIAGFEHEAQQGRSCPRFGWPEQLGKAVPADGNRFLLPINQVKCVRFRCRRRRGRADL